MQRGRGHRGLQRAKDLGRINRPGRSSIGCAAPLAPVWPVAPLAPVWPRASGGSGRGRRASAESSVQDRVGRSINRLSDGVGIEAGLGALVCAVDPHRSRR